ncbi:MAG: hypothetical protein M0Q15_16020 [Nevskia sp.]|jgi:hypothetical protein|nr:hypothetical protein [Nevskia sp.]
MNTRNTKTKLLIGASMLTAVFGTAGCSDAQRANMGRYGERHEIVCYSGGKEIVRSESTGKPMGSDNFITWSDGKTGWGSTADCVYHAIN